MINIFNYLLNLTNSIEYSVNPLLVVNNIRKSFLIQKCDKCFNNIDTTEYINILKKIYPYINIININIGYLFTKDKYLPFDINNYSITELGEYLSYPFPGDIINNRKYQITIKLDYNVADNCIIGFISGSKNNYKLTNLFNNISEYIDTKLSLKCKPYIDIIKIYDISILSNDINKIFYDKNKKRYVYNILLNMYTYEEVNIIFKSKNDIKLKSILIDIENRFNSIK